MEDMTSEAEAAEGAPEAFLSTLDIFILGALIGFIFYWLFIRNKKQEPVAIKKLTVVKPPVATSGFDSSFINKMKHSGRNVVIFYGSQTGTAEEFAGRLSKDCVRYGMKGMIADPEECEMEELSQLSEIENSLAIFCMATYGEGDPTDNSQEFYEWLQAGDGELEGVKYAVFSLGNKTYEHYNAMGRYVDKRLEELGATRVCEAGEGDDDANIEEDFLSWREKFWPTVCEFYGVQPIGDEVSMRQYNLTVHDEIEKSRVFTGEPARLGSYKLQKPPYDAKNPFMAPVLINKELHKDGDRSCMHIELDISGSKIRYDAGDHVAVYPINDAVLVDYIGQRLKIDLDQVVTLTNIDEEASKKHPFPCPSTYRTILSHYIDITHPPRTHVLKELAEYCSEEKDKQFLQSMAAATTEAKHLYSEWVVKDHRNITAVLEDIKSLNPPLDHVIELLPKLQPRYYSISSSPKMYPNSIHITAVLVDWVTRAGRPAKGVATTWLKSKIPTNGLKPTVPVFVRKSTFRLPFKPTTPVIMIGPGTGVAPFRGFVQQRAFDAEAGKPVGDTILYFGCRKAKEDFIYEDELRKYESDKVLILHTAFSRDQAHKVYVQHLLEQNKDEVWKVLDNNGHLYICGDARNMARDVHKTVVSILEECGKMTEEQAENYVKKLQAKGRYSTDVWS